jgi:hypothetical protein
MKSATIQESNHVQKMVVAIEAERKKMSRASHGCEKKDHLARM